MAHLGFPIVGDPLYLVGGQIGLNQTLSVEAAPMCLHAFSLSIIHPGSNQRETYQAALPQWTKG
jgi:23S rRNA-/tRNA-specific pseudouridylate synthase